MSTLRVNELLPTSGDIITLKGEVLIEGKDGNIIIGGTGSSDLSASYAATAGCASNINISTIVPGDTTTSVVLVGEQAVGCQSPFIDSGLTYNAATNILNATVTTAQTASYVNPLNQNVTINGNVTASGDIRLTTAGNAVIRPIINLIPTGTASFNPNSTNTSTYADYGINVISTASSQSYCLRLPQTPTQGKTVTLVNKSGINILVFPSVIGGDINGVIDGYLVIPSDGKSYSFDCYENPLPGGWAVTNVNAPSTTITSGVINYNYTSSAGNIAFVNDSIKVSGSNLSSTNAYDGLNTPQYVIGSSINAFGGENIFGRIYPDTITGQNTWNSINSVQVLTNLSASNVQAYLRLSLGTNIEFYENANPTGPVQLFFPSGPYNTFNTNVVTPWINNHPGTINSWILFNNTTTTPNNFSCSWNICFSSQNPYTSANVGDPGTLIINIPSLPTYTAAGGGFKMLGRNYIGSFVHPVQGLLDAYYNAEFCPIFSLSVFDNLFNNVSNVPNAKLQVSYNVSL
jgi:hypothetical protein